MTDKSQGSPTNIVTPTREILLKPFFLLRTLLRDVLVSKRYPALVQLLSQLRPIDCGVELMRFGPQSDGGYLIPNDLNGIVACFSPGVCQTSGFEMDCANIGIPVYLADGSVNGPAEYSSLFYFTKKYLGGKTSHNFMTLEDWVNANTSVTQGDLLLQMDIEGYEYEVLNGTANHLLNRFRILVIEFHGLHSMLNGNISNWLKMQKSFLKLLENHVCIHSHPNNTSKIRIYRELEIPDVMEMTFLRIDRLKGRTTFASLFPHPLDNDNDRCSPHMQLPRCWRAFK